MQLLRFGVQQQNRGGFGVGQVGGFADDTREEMVEVGGGVEDPADFHQTSHPFGIEFGALRVHMNPCWGYALTK